MLGKGQKDTDMPRFDYICYHNTEEGYKIDDFTLFAEVVERTDETVSYKRFLCFGRVKSDGIITIPIEKFEHFYVPITDEIFQECIKAKKERVNAR